MTINGNSIGYCRIRLGGPNAFCSYYVVAKPSPTTGHQGWPRNVDDRGTGCVNDPGAPCVFTLDQYRNWPLPDREAMCASRDVLTNAVAQLRHAIANCVCDVRPLIPTAAPVTSAPVTPAPVTLPPVTISPTSSAPATRPPFEICVYRGDLLSKSDSELLSMTMNGNSIGYCRIGPGGPGAFCSYYVVAKPSPTTGHQGWPRNKDDLGTGCVYDPGATPCFFIRDEYSNWPFPDREAMCASQDVLTNAVAQLRHAITNCACGDIPTEAPVTSAPVTSAPVTSAPVTLAAVTLPPAVKVTGPIRDPCTLRNFLLSKSDSELLSMTMNGNSIGECRIGPGGPNSFCSYYVVARPSPTTGHRGWPRNVDDLGTGCVYDPDATPCFFTLDQYRNWPLPDREAMCASQDVLTNAVAQLRHAIAKCACGGITLAPSAVPSPAPAVTKGHAGHLSPFG